MALKFLNNGYFAGKVGIGTQTPLRGDLVVKGNFQTVSSGNGQLAIISGVLGSNPSDADVGGQMVFGGPISSSDSNRTFGLVGGYKENNTSGDRSGYLSFGTRQNTGSRDIFERMRIDSSGVITFSKTANTNTPAGSINHASNDFVYFTGGTGGASFGDDGQGTRMLAFNSDYLRFDTGDTGEKMRITSTGNVGINTTSPQAFAKLDIRSGTSDGNAAIAAYSYNGVGGFAILGHAYAIDNTHAGSATGLRGISNGGRTVSGSVNIGGYFTASGSENNYALITDSGNVGIGTTSPQSKLHIESTGEALRFTRSGQETYRVIHGTSGLYFSAPNAGDLVFGITQNSDVDIFNTSGSVMFRADGSTSNVGIGTTSPTANLHISDTADAVLKIEGDTINSDETKGPKILLITDNGYRTAAITGGNATYETSSGNFNALNLQSKDIRFHTGTAQDYDLAVERMRITGTGALSFGSTGTAYGMLIKLIAGGTHTITWPASVDWAGGTAPDAPASGETDMLGFITHDGGTTWYGFLSGDALS